MNYLTLLLCISPLVLTSTLATPFPKLAQNGGSRMGRSNHGRIVDGAGYSIHNTGFSLDLAMQTNAPVGGESLALVTLGPFTNGRDQKWGTSFYGLPNEVEMSNGLYGKNFVSVYYPAGASRDKARLYKYETLSSPDLYRILNLETRLCLVAIQRSSSDPISVEFGNCTEGNSTWLLRRTG